MAKKYFWFKMQEDFFKSKEVKKLRKIAGGDTYTIIYQKMILLSIRTEGKILYDGVEDSFAEEIALQIDEEADNVKVVVNYLMKYNLVDIMSENELIMTEAIKHIGTQDESTERVRLHRERKKALLLPLHVTNETTDIELDIEKDSEKEKNSTLNLSNFAKAYIVAFKDYFGMMPRAINKDDFDIDLIDGIDMITMFTEFFDKWEYNNPFDRDQSIIKSECSIENIHAQIPRYYINGEW